MSSQPRYKTHRQQAQTFGIWCLFNLPQFITISFTTFLLLDKCRKPNRSTAVDLFGTRSQVFMARLIAAGAHSDMNSTTLLLRQLNAIIIELIRRRKCSQPSTLAIYVRFIDRKSRSNGRADDDFTTCWNATRTSCSATCPLDPDTDTDFGADRIGCGSSAAS